MNRLIPGSEIDHEVDAMDEDEQTGYTNQLRTFQGEFGSVESNQALDPDGNPAGGMTGAKGILIEWQDGPIDREAGEEPNGASLEDAIVACLHRAHHFNQGKWRCRENSLAITHLEEALLWLTVRRHDRAHRSVLGSHES